MLHLRNCTVAGSAPVIVFGKNTGGGSRIIIDIYFILNLYIMNNIINSSVVYDITSYNLTSNNTTVLSAFKESGTTTLNNVVINGSLNSSNFINK